eukprot:51241-Amphidinium_carterae.1
MEFPRLLQKESKPITLRDDGWFFVVGIGCPAVPLAWHMSTTFNKSNFDTHLQRVGAVVSLCKAGFDATLNLQLVDCTRVPVLTVSTCD